MSGSGVTTKQDKHKWTQQIENVLKDPNGIFRFEEYLRDHELQHYIPILHACLKKKPDDRKEELKQLDAPYKAFADKLNEEQEEKKRKKFGKQRTPKCVTM